MKCIGLVLLLFSQTALANPFDHVKVIRVHDGDTFTIEVPKVDAVFGKSISVRVYGIDTPEIHGKLPCEKEAAEQAHIDAEGLLLNAKVVSLKNVKRDKYFRLLAEVYIDGKSYSDIMLNSRLAYPYFGKTKAKTNWCEYQNQKK